LCVVIDITGLRNTAYNTTAIIITWRYPSTQNQLCGKNISYLITVSYRNHTKIITSRYTNCTITDLVSDTRYTVTVVATNGDIVGYQSWIAFMTNEQQNGPIEG